MSTEEFDEIFLPIARMTFSGDRLLDVYKVYSESLKNLNAKIFKEACLKICDQENVTSPSHFPSPGKFKAVFMECMREESTPKRDPSIGNRPQDLAAMRKFYETVQRLSVEAKKRAKTREGRIPGGFFTPIMGIATQVSADIVRMERYIDEKDAELEAKNVQAAS